MDASATSRSATDPAAPPDTDEPWSTPIGISARSAAAADDRLARAVRRHATRGEDATGGDKQPATDPPAPTPHATPSPTPAADATAPHPAAPRDHAASTDPTTPEGNPLRAWDSVRPKQDDIGGWRWHGHAWSWEDARGKQADAPEWSKPTFAGTFDGFRVPLDSALAIRLYQNDPASADTIAPGVMAQAAAAISDGRLAAKHAVSDLVPLMQRMTADKQLDVAHGVAALREHGVPAGLVPYATLKPETATFFEDGTRNQKDLASDHGGTNVAAMFALMDIASRYDSRIPEPHYHGGPGNEKDFDPFMQGIGSATGAGVGRILRNVRAQFSDELRMGIRRFAIFGFSRGAAEAVETTHLFEDAAKDARASYELGFLGLFDTVAAIGPTGDGNGSLRLKPARDGGRPERIYHAMAEDETRTKFEVVDVGVSGVDHVIKDAFPGAHSDVGGSYANKGLSNIALHRMVEEARRAGTPMPTLEETIARHPEEAARLLPFLHQDGDQSRHFIDPIYSGTEVRRLPADVRRSESPQVALHLDTRRVRDPDAEFDRRASHAYRDVTVGVIRVDPSGRFQFTDEDPLPGASLQAHRVPSRRDMDHRVGIVIEAHLEDGSLLVNPMNREEPHERRR